MGIASAFMNQTIDTIYSVARDGYSDTTSTSVYTNVACRWQEKQGRIVGPDKELKEYTVIAFIDAENYTLLYDYEYSKDSETFKTVALTKRYNLSGKLDHYQVYLI